MLIEKYNPLWAQNFIKIKAEIQCALKGKNIRIEHIGSTSVPGLSAKPIIDIDIVYHPSIILEEISIQLSAIGYYHNGNQGISAREVFKREDNRKHYILDKIDHHLYACPSNSDELLRHLLFRDYLKNNVREREEYQELKYQLAIEANQDKKIYAIIKEDRATDFINSIIEKA